MKYLLRKNIMSWRLLIVSVVGPNSALRLRLWRQLKAAGAVALRDGAYLLPDRPELAPVFDNWRDEIVATGSNAYVVQVPVQTVTTENEWLNLFDRTEDYRNWADSLQLSLEALPASEPEARRALRQRRKELDAIQAIDFFSGEANEKAQREYVAAEHRIIRHYSHDEPLSTHRDIQRLQRTDYQARLWATRARPWVDRVASAWLIRRFIDTNAKFIWLSNIVDCPSNALGFDFDGATFTHVDERVTFEVLLASFSLENDEGLQRLAAMVHALDVNGEVTAEGAGFEAILSGARARLENDDDLLADISATLDSLYTFFKNIKKQSK